MNKGLKELAGGNLGAVIGVLIIVLVGQFTAIEWKGETDLLVVLCLQSLWSFIRPYIPAPPDAQA